MVAEARVLSIRPRKRDAWPLLGLVLHVVLPYLLVQVGNLGLWRRGRPDSFEVALTFDDGPDPVSTPQILDTLKEANVRATFFVVGELLLEHPDLARRLVREGHEVGLHCFSHRHAWLLAPWSAVSDVRRGRRAFRTVFGTSPRLYRPPHGAYTAATVLAARMSGMRGVHWTIMGRDWLPEMTPEKIVARVVSHLEPGSVIVLHDAGPGARGAVPALPKLLAELRGRGVDVRPVGELTGVRPEGLAELLARRP